MFDWFRRNRETLLEIEETIEYTGTRLDNHLYYQTRQFEESRDRIQKLEYAGTILFLATFVSKDEYDYALYVIAACLEMKKEDLEALTLKRFQKRIELGTIDRKVERQVLHDNDPSH